jgi:hypothetical protein
MELEGVVDAQVSRGISAFLSLLVFKFGIQETSSTET